MDIGHIPGPLKMVMRAFECQNRLNSCCKVWRMHLPACPLIVMTLTWAVLTTSLSFRNYKEQSLPPVNNSNIGMNASMP